MKVRYLLGAGVIIAALTAIPCSFAQEKESTDVVVVATSTLGQNVKNQTPQSLSIDTNEQEKKEEEIRIEEVHDYVYTTNRVNIRTHVGTDSAILLTAEAGTKLERIECDIIPNWDTVIINENSYYIFNEYLTEEVPEQEAKSIEEQLKDAELSAEDLRYMSAIIYAEAGNQCQAGQQAVGIIVMERKKSDVYADTVHDVIYESGQFSTVANGSLTKALNLYDNGKLPNEVIEAAKYALQGNTTVYYNNATYDLAGYLYFSRYVRGCRLQIQDHMFK